MAGPIRIGDCGRIPDKRARRVREKLGEKNKVRVRRMTGQTHQFLIFPRMELKVVECPAGWISRAGYNRCPKITLAKMRLRNVANSRLREQ
jgi:hypothetical protein